MLGLLPFGGLRLLMLLLWLWLRCRCAQRRCVTQFKTQRSLNASARFLLRLLLLLLLLIAGHQQYTCGIRCTRITAGARRTGATRLADALLERHRCGGRSGRR